MPIIPSILLSASLLCGASGAGSAANAEAAADIERIISELECDNASVYNSALKDLLSGIIDDAIDDSICERLGLPAEPTADVPAKPTATPTAEPTAEPTVTPAAKPTAEPTVTPTAEPTVEPTVTPAAEPTVEPTVTPTAEPTAEPAAAASSTVSPFTTEVPTTDSEFAAEVIRLVNEERAKEGLTELTASADLTAAANQRAVEISSVFSHARPSGANFSTVLAEYGISYRAAGENIAYGQQTPEAVVEAWMNSSGHRANILSSDYTEIGVGLYKSGNTYYWTQLFVG